MNSGRRNIAVYFNVADVGAVLLSLFFHGRLGGHIFKKWRRRTIISWSPRYPVIRAS